MDLQEKLAILSGAAKYDVSCSSSGSDRKSTSGVGSTVSCGICHSWAEDGRCVSLLKVLFTNHCIYDCAYCANRRTNDIPRAAFTPEELIDLTMQFYKHNYIEGLFLSSGIMRNPDYTMEQLISVVKKLREERRYNGYIHLKIIPGANDDLIRAARRYADRVSVNIELPSTKSLQLLAPDKTHAAITRAFNIIPVQSTQLIIGATPESDLHIVSLAEQFYQKQKLKRVYYSGYVPVNSDSRLPAVITKPPLVREHRLYQADWLLRYYHFTAGEILTKEQPNLDEAVDPKTGWALRHPEFYPVEINHAEYEVLLRIPGVGVTSAKRIVAARRYHSLDFIGLKRIGVVLKRAKHFITCNGRRDIDVRTVSPLALHRFFALQETKLLPGQEQLVLINA
jgi:predicted DNA-binding helix-hairpin-helix protein